MQNKEKVVLLLKRTRKQPPELNGKTPQWFQDWHNQHYLPAMSRISTNRKLIWILLASSLAGAVTGDNVDALDKIVYLLGG